MLPISTTRKLVSSHHVTLVISVIHLLVNQKFEYNDGDPPLQKVTCEEPICGVGIELRVIHQTGDSRYQAEACIHMREIEVYASEPLLVPGT